MRERDSCSGIAGVSSRWCRFRLQPAGDIWARALERLLVPMQQRSPRLHALSGAALSGLSGLISLG